MDGAKRVVDAAVGLAFEYDPSALNLDQIEAERLADRRLEAATRHRLKLLQAVRRGIGFAVHNAHHGSWKGRTSARNDQASFGWCARWKTSAAIEAGEMKKSSFASGSRSRCQGTSITASTTR